MPASSMFFIGTNANPNHPALVIVSFFDGHTASIADSVNISDSSKSNYVNYLPGP